VLTDRAVSVTHIAVAEVSATAAPSSAVVGAVPPTARRTITAARSGSVGLAHDRVRLVALRLAIASPVTKPGAVLSGGTRGAGGAGVKARPDPTYRPVSGLRTERTCLVLEPVVPAATTSARWGASR
jgi:hypothetical protein